MAGLETGVVNISISESLYLLNISSFNFLGLPQRAPELLPPVQRAGPGSLDNGTLNFAICKEPIPGPNLEWTPLCKDRMCALLPVGHRFSDRKSLHLAELKEEHFIISNLGYDMSTSFTKMCNLAGLILILYEGNGEDLCGNMVDMGLGIMIAPYSINLAFGKWGSNALPFQTFRWLTTLPPARSASSTAEVNFSPRPPKSCAAVWNTILSVCLPLSWNILNFHR